jgi:GNAT superfamily N-acetyltransferase
VGVPAELTFSDAETDDFEELTALHAGVAADLTARFGDGHWSRDTFGSGLDVMPGRSRVRVGRYGGRILTSLRLQTQKPWAVDVMYFTPVARPLYLTGMAVRVGKQRQGLGRAALADAHRIAEAWPADAIRLDAYDSLAGAGGFYAKCGYAERGRVRYRGSPLVYYERLFA